MSVKLTMPRPQLRQIIADAAAFADLPADITEKLLATADTIPRVAFGMMTAEPRYFDGGALPVACGCPMVEAGYYHDADEDGAGFTDDRLTEVITLPTSYGEERGRHFMNHFDSAMHEIAERQYYGWDFDEYATLDGFVEVTDD